MSVRRSAVLATVAAVLATVAAGNAGARPARVTMPS
jgi:hypothetical protein